MPLRAISNGYTITFDPEEGAWEAQVPREAGLSGLPVVAAVVRAIEAALRETPVNGESASESRWLG